MLIRACRQELLRMLLLVQFLLWKPVSLLTRRYIFFFFRTGFLSFFWCTEERHGNLRRLSWCSLWIFEEICDHASGFFTDAVLQSGCFESVERERQRERQRSSTWGLVTSSPVSSHVRISENWLCICASVQLPCVVCFQTVASWIAFDVQLNHDEMLLGVWVLILIKNMSTKFLRCLLCSQALHCWFY